MSLLGDLYNDKALNLPNDVHNDAGIADDGTKVYLGSDTLTWDAKQRRDAIASGAVKPAMAYSQDELVKNAQTGLWATTDTVESQINLRENTPRG